MEYKFKKKVNVSTADFWYDLSAGGYLTPEDFTKDKETINAINDAVELLQKLEEMCEYT